MTDRRMDKMIIFGPEWLRNLSREGSSVSNNHQQNSGGVTVPSVPTNPTPAPKYQLADYRYGREEMLALFDKHLEPPNELRDCQLLYIAKSQLPLALTNENFDEEAPEQMLQRNNVPLGSPMAAERVGAPRGQSVDRGRGRGRLPFYTGYGPGRSQSTYHPTRGTEDTNYGGETSAIPAQNRLWNPGNVSPMAPNARNGPEGSDWGGKEYNTRLFKRYPDNSNWRRQPNQNRNFGEDEGGWRAPELSRINRQNSMQNTSQDKWERDWNDRGRERPTSWNPTNRRPWAGDSQSPDDHLPEWAVDNTTDVGGTFDALGAFHGISSDDLAVPRYSSSGGDGQYGLSRSHTQGSLGNRGRNPVADDNYNNPSEDLWYTERHNMGKKGTKSTFDATEIKFRKSIVPDFDGGRHNAKVHKEQMDHHDDKNNINASSSSQHKLRENVPTDYAIPNPKEEEGFKELRKSGIVATQKNYQHKTDYKETKVKKADPDKNYGEDRKNQEEKELAVSRDKENSNEELQRQFEGLMRNTPPDVDKQSVLITANNSLRQKHQNIVSEEISAPLSSQLVSSDGASKDNMLSETDISQDSIVRNLWNTINFDHEEDLSMRNLSQMQQRPQLLGAGDANVLPKTGPNLILSQNMMGSSDLHTIQSAQGLTNTDTRANTAMHLQFMQQQQQQTQQPYSTAMIALMQQKEMQLNFIPGYDKWYYEDPQLQTQGPFSSMEMTEWYRAGFFNRDLLVRRGHETHMRPLGIYGPIPPFMLATVPLAQLEMASTAAEQRPPQMPLGGPPPMGRAPNMVAAMSNIVDPAMKNILQYSNMGSNIAGNLTGNLTSNISANMSSNLTSNIAGNLSGNLATNLPGNNDLVGSPLMMQRMLSTPAETGVAGRMYTTQDIQQHKPSSAQGYQAEAAMYRPYEQTPQMAFLHQLQHHPHLQDERMNQFQQPPPPLPSRNDISNTPLDLQSQRQEEPIKSFIRQLSSQQKQNEVETMWNMQGQYTWGPSVTTSSVSGSLPTSMWDMQPPSVIHPNALLPDIVKKDMKTEQQILEETKLAASRLALSQAQQPTISSPFAPTDLGGLNLQTTAANIGASMQSQQINITANPAISLGSSYNSQIETQSSVFDSGNLKNVILPPQEKPSENVEPVATALKQVKSPADIKQTKSNKTEIKTKQDTVPTKTDVKQGRTKAKAKDEKKEDTGEKKVKEEEKGKSERKTEEVVKTKKETDKSKKEQERERKDSAEKWSKEGFIEVKANETKSNKESKKKVEEARKLEEAEKKRKEEEKRNQDEIQRRQAESVKKLHEQQILQTQQQQQQQQQARNLANNNKRAAWASITNQLAQTTQKDKLSLAEIQRLEREKKVEQLKEQQQMVQLIAQQQQAAMQREQEMQLGWAKQKGTNKSPPTQVKSLSEIQAEEARRQQAAVVEEQAKRAADVMNAPSTQTPASTPWSNTHNGGLSTYMAGFWDAMPVASTNRPAAGAVRSAEKPPSPLKSPEPARPRKPKQQPPPAQPSKEQNAATEFNKWCCDTLASYNADVDVPTFIAFLKDIESPYEVRDYVKCYLGDSKDTSDFARQFLEKRSKLLRIAQATPVDDLCSPAPAINPGSAGNSDFQEVKVKGKKIKKNKMLKVDARILGFSVTASEDRINVGDIDTV